MCVCVCTPIKVDTAFVLLFSLSRVIRRETARMEHRNATLHESEIRILLGTMCGECWTRYEGKKYTSEIIVAGGQILHRQFVSMKIRAPAKVPARALLAIIYFQLLSIALQHSPVITTGVGGIAMEVSLGNSFRRVFAKLPVSRGASKHVLRY